MAKIQWSISVTPVESTAAGADGGPMQVDTISHNFQRSLGGGKANGTWDGNDSSEWSSGVHTHITSGGGTITIPDSTNAVWVKNTGYAYDAAQANNKGTTAVSSNVYIVVTGGDIASGDYDLCRLAPGEGIYIPKPNIASGADATFTLSDDGDAQAIEYAIFT